MSIRLIHLRKLLALFYAPPNLRTTTLRNDIRSELRRESGESDEGGDFYVPFWADAKEHMFGTADLKTLTEQRVLLNSRRKRLYEACQDGFLSWWDNRRRWRNEPIQPTPLPAKARLPITAVGGVVKIENVFALDSGPTFHRLIYPYFSEKPTVGDEAARLGLWALAASLGAGHDINNMRILDIQRGASFGLIDVPFTGEEKEIFERRYAFVISEWDRLRAEY